jgi:lantibiotic modifying enzyme
MSIRLIIPYYFQIKMCIFFIKRFGLGIEQFRIMSSYFTGKLFPEREDEKHLEAAIEWLAYSHDVSKDSGIPNVFSFKDGWGESYPETSGYILATFLAYAEYSGDKSYIKRAKEIGNWEIDIQAPNGGVFSSTTLKQTRVFNTGQVMLGWCNLYVFTKDKRFLNAARRSGNYLLTEQERNGSWVRDTYCGARTYDARVDWALLRLYQLTGETIYRDSAIKNLVWILAQQTESGWFKECGFTDDLPIMHVIVYTLRGLLECELLDEPKVKELKIMPKVIKASDALCAALTKQPVKGILGMVPYAFDENWSGVATESNLTGNAQLACFLYRLSHVTDNDLYRLAADKVLSATKRTQLIDTSITEIRGAIAGTYPIYKGYVANGFPNWATKFYADALLMKIEYVKKTVVLA